MFKALLRVTILIFVFSFFFDPSPSAQGAEANEAWPTRELGPDPRKSYDLIMMFGTLLPFRNGLRESVPGWSFRLGAPTPKGVFEGGLYSGIGNGIVYRSATVDFRMDILVEPITAHFLLGFHGDQFTSETASSRFAGGWHYGGGFTQYLAGPLLFRFDFRYRYSPGQAAEITAGLVYRIGAAQGN